MIAIYTHTHTHAHLYTYMCTRVRLTGDTQHATSIIIECKFHVILFAVLSTYFPRERQEVCLDLHFNFLLENNMRQIGKHRLGIMLCFKQSLLRGNPRANIRIASLSNFNSFWIFHYLFFCCSCNASGALVGCVSGRRWLVAIFLFNYTRSGYRDRGCGRGRQHCSLARTWGMSMSLLVDLLIASTVFVFTPSGSACCDLLQI